MFNYTKNWTQGDLPKLFTAINSQEILASRYLTVSFAMTEYTNCTPDNIAYAVIELSQLKPLIGSDYAKQFAAD
jgi:hypothetical protein